MKLSGLTRILVTLYLPRGIPQRLFDLHNADREAVTPSLPRFVRFFVEYKQQSAIGFRRFWKFLPDVISRMPC